MRSKEFKTESAHNNFLTLLFFLEHFFFGGVQGPLDIDEVRPMCRMNEEDTYHVVHLVSRIHLQAYSSSNVLKGDRDK